MKRRWTAVLISIVAFLMLMAGNAYAAAETVTGVSLGRYYSAAIKNDGSLWTWGNNQYGRLGNGTTNTTYTPIKIMENVKSVAFGYGHAAAIKNDGSLWMWGSNAWGELGNGTDVNSTIPIKVMEGVKSVSLGEYYTAVIKNDGSLWMWGSNGSGQLGNSTTNKSTVPIKIMENVKSVSLGFRSTAAVKNDGSLWTWGYNHSYGLLGNGTTNISTVPCKIMDNVKLVAMGYKNSAAIKNDDSLWMWGNNDYGQMGNGTQEFFTNYTSPIKVMENIKSVSVGSDRTAAVKNDGSLWMWGRNILCGSENGSQTDSNTPIEVMKNIKSVSFPAEGTHGAVIKNDGSLWMWGDHSFGQLGNGTEWGKSLPPVKVKLTITPDVPTHFNVSATTANQLDCTWNVVKGASSYELQYSTSSSYANATTIAVNGRARAIQRLASGTTYYVRLRTVVVDGGSKYYSDWTTARETTMAAPATPTQPSTPATPAVPTKITGDISPSSPVAAATVERTVLSQTTDKDPAGSTYQLLRAKGVAKSKSSIKISWKRISGASAYVIYGNKCGKSNRYKKITTVTGTSYTQKKLKKGTYYKYLVVAVNGDKALATSKTIHVVTKGGKNGNYSKVTVKKAKVSLKAGKTAKIKAKASGKKVKKHRGISFESSNPKVATVTSKGVIKAVSRGTCYIYAYAQNGVYKRITVKVK